MGYLSIYETQPNMLEAGCCSTDLPMRIVQEKKSGAIKRINKKKVTVEYFTNYK